MRSRLSTADFIRPPSAGPVRASNEGSLIPGRLTLPIVMLAVLFAFAAPASAHDHDPLQLEQRAVTDSPRKPCGHKSANVDHVAHGVASFKRWLDRAFSAKRWRDPTPVTPKQRKRLRHHKRCARFPGLAREMRQLEREARREHRERRRDRLRAKREAKRSDCIPGVTIYHGLGGCWAIPVYVVACESGGSWTAYNPSGAAGPYQIMPMHGRPFPVATTEQKREHHRIAARLWNGGTGASNWVCA